MAYTTRTRIATRPARPAYNTPQHAWEFDAEDGRWIELLTGAPLTERIVPKRTSTVSRTCGMCGSMHAGTAPCKDEWAHRPTCPTCFIQLPATGICDDCA